jgi:hypothetical protein
MVHLTVEPRRVMTWDEFRAEKPPYSIALDGHVNGPTRFDAVGPYQSFNHHEDVLQAVTKATCNQVFTHIKMGLFHIFEKRGKPHAHVFVNDPDQDTSLAFWLLQHSQPFIGTRNEGRIHQLVTLEDYFDTTGGAYPLDASDYRFQEITWVFEPYERARCEGKVSTMNAAQMQNTIIEVGQRITQYVKGNGKRIRPDTRYEELGGEGNWRLVREIGTHARSELLQKGITAIISVRENSNSTYGYSVIRLTPYSTFNNKQFYDLCNETEADRITTSDRWGGGDMSGGSPRDIQSSIPPEKILPLARMCAYATSRKNPPAASDTISLYAEPIQGGAGAYTGTTRTARLRR